MSMQFAQGYGTTSVGADFGSAQPQPDPMASLGPNIFPAQPGQLPPEAFQSQTPTVRTLPPKVVKILFHLNIKLILFHQKLLPLDFNQSSHQVLLQLLYHNSK